MVPRNARLSLFLPLIASLLACGSASSTGSLASLEEELKSGSVSTGTAASFAVLGFAAMTCTDGNINGQVGTNQSLTDVPPGAIALTRCPTAGTHVGDQAAKDAYAAFLDRYAALRPKQGDVCTELSGTLASRTLSPGTYCFPAAAALTGVLTLDGPPTGTWIFKIGSTLATPPALPTGALTGTNFSVVMAGGGQPCNVTWWVAEAATMTDSNLAGTILAGAAITLTRGTLSGNAYAKAGATVTGTAVTACASSAGGPPACPGKDFVTGGGFIKADHGRAIFAVTGGTRKGALRGHLTYHDHGSNGPTAKGTGVTAYAVIDATTRRIGGTATVNGKPGFTYQVDVSDKGEPGRRDTFSIRLSNKDGYSYAASGTLLGGNIQLHKAAASCKGHDDDDGQGDDDDHDDDDHGDDDDHNDHNEGHGK
jgi:hypothetical protein